MNAPKQAGLHAAERDDNDPDWQTFDIPGYKWFNDARHRVVDYLSRMPDVEDDKHTSSLRTSAEDSENDSDRHGDDEDFDENELARYSSRTAAIDFVAAQNVTDREELLFRAHRHASERTGRLPVPVAQRVVQDFVAAVGREASRVSSTGRRTAARTSSTVPDFPDELMF